MKIVTYNVNGIRASAKLGLINWLEEFDGDVYCIQEVRCDEEKTRELLFGKGNQTSMFEIETTGLEKYYAVYNCGKVAGYAGTMTLSKTKPDKVFYDMGQFWQDNEGRTTTIILGDLAIVNAYIPNGNSRLEFKMQYLEALKKFVEKLQEQYNVVCVGDFNIAHNEIDITNPRECRNRSVFLPIERQAFGEFISLGLVDSFRHVNPDLVKYSWRSYKSRVDENRKGWMYRIDYILISSALADRLVFSDILDLPYSDHLPVVSEIL